MSKEPCGTCYDEGVITYSDPMEIACVVECPACIRRELQAEIDRMNAIVDYMQGKWKP